MLKVFYRRAISAHHADRTAFARRTGRTDGAAFAGEAAFTARSASAGQARRSLQAGLAVFAGVARSAGNTRKSLIKLGELKNTVARN